jgi:hypothetical protein
MSEGNLGLSANQQHYLLSRLKVATPFQICDEPDLPRVPSEQLLRARARRPEVPRREVREEAEMGRGFVRRLADDPGSRSDDQAAIRALQRVAEHLDGAR